MLVHLILVINVIGKISNEDASAFLTPELVEIALQHIPNSVFGWNNTKRNITIDCIPKDGSANTTVEMFDWRFLNKKPVLNGPKYNINAKNGRLTITNPKQEHDNSLHCNVIGPGEAVTTFTYNLVTVMPATFRYRYVLTGYILVPCSSRVHIEGIIKYISDESKRMLCLKFFTKCPIKSLGVRFYQDFNDETNDNEPGCLITMEYLHEEPEYIPTNYTDVKDLRQAVNKYLTDPNRMFWEDTSMKRYYDRYFEKEVKKGTAKSNIYKYVIFNRFSESACPPGYIVIELTFCLPCPPGTFASETIGQTFNNVFCKACEEQTYQQAFHATKCLDCQVPLQVTEDKSTCFSKKITKLDKPTSEDVIQKIAFGIKEVDMVIGNEPIKPNLYERLMWNKTFQILLCILMNSLFIGAAVVGILYYRKRVKDIYKKKKYEQLSQTEYHLMNKIARLDMIRTRKEPLS